MSNLSKNPWDTVGKACFTAIQVFAIIFCIAPALIVLIYSFYEDVFINFPPVRPGLALYENLFTEQRWLDAIWVSFKVCVPAALLTVLLVVPAAIALERAKVKNRDALEFTALIPMLIPTTAYAVGVYIIYLELGLVGNYWGIVFAEAIIAAPASFLIVRAALRRLPHNLDQVAMSLGASRIRALLDVTVRLLIPAMAVSGLFAFIHAFNDATFIVFLSGPGLSTVAKTIFDALAYAIEPEVAALSGVFMLFVMLLVVLGQVMRRKTQSR